MLSMFNLSLTLANTIYTVSYAMVVLGAVLTLIGTIGLFWSDGVRDKFADERISSNEAATAKAKAEAAAAQLETERLKRLVAWRRMSPLQHQVLVERLRGKLAEGVWIETVGTDPEASQLHQDIVRAFEEAGVKVHTFTGWERAVGVGITNGPPASQELIRQAFLAIGVVLHEKPSGLMKKSGDKVEIIVGTKPPPELVPR